MVKKKNTITFLTDKLDFPPVGQASAEGLIAVGGDLSPERLLLAYSRGIFPWFNEDSLILWWSPDPRMVLFPNKVKISKSMRKVIQKGHFSLTRNRSFERVIEECAKVNRSGQQGTWITEAMIKAYLELHKKGYAISYEVWQEDVLVGGLYGVDLGHIFCGESMFSKVDNASKYALILAAQELKAEDYRLIDCQLHTPHLESLGAEEISRQEYLTILQSKI
ncbi:MAG: leucyl/phenylalanyl-tRNA--protein transferase [Flavobacteriaceae bacterium]